MVRRARAWPLSPLQSRGQRRVRRREVCGLSIGETLARARRDAGLSVADISHRTRIRESVIERIERDDYSASGIDRFTRGEIREIARAVGVDSRPLLGEYEWSRPPAGPVG